ncbi:MAG: tyrosine-type recombinase/integrase [Planctomycetota bacterium]
MLNQLRRPRVRPRLTQDDLTDQLRAIKEERPRPAFLKPQEIKRLLAAAVRHDAETYALTRAEKADGLGAGEGITRKHDSVLPLVVLRLLTGARLEELLSLRWEHVDLERGVIEFNAEHVKTGEDREVWLDKTPALARLLAALKLRSAGPFVIGGQAGWTRATATKARKRLTDRFGAPEFNWSQRSGRTPALRSTCATYSVNAAGVWGEASIYVAARRLGHSIRVAERRYQRRHRVSHEATTLEEAMEAADAFRQAVDAVAGVRAKLAAEAG